MADFRDQGIDPAIKATAALVGDLGMVVALSPNSPLPAGTNTLGTVNIGADPDTVASGTITATDLVVSAPTGTGALLSGASTAGSLVSLLCTGGDTAWIIQVSGLVSGTLYFEASVDSTNGTDGNWIAVNGRQTGVVNTVLANNTTVNGFYRGNTSGTKYLRVRSVGLLVGTPAIIIRVSAGTGAIFLNASIPAGSNTLGNVGLIDALGNKAAFNTKGEQQVSAASLDTIATLLMQLIIEAKKHTFILSSMSNIWVDDSEIPTDQLFQ